MTSFPSKERLAHIVYESDDRASKNFDLGLLVLILLSVLVVILDSVREIHLNYGSLLYWLEWFFTIVFTLEYLLRIWLSNDRPGYIFGFYGIVDLLAILPTFLSLILVQSQYLMVVRALRFLRILRILKLPEYLREAALLASALKNSRAKIQIFVGSVLTIVLVMGSIMYIIEGPENGYTSIPRAMYWAIVTLTTVGYGDISPNTDLGQFMASIIMLLGYAIIAVPTGIVTSEMTFAKSKTEAAGEHTLKICKTCRLQRHSADAVYCRQCGSKLEPPE
ncbi:voltage-gated potassium channel [Cyclobacterium lianum]|uniref:Voltage-gated potassium channel n=1 Tax=Cyclobacterium lianum TaxID=388280 RepID=A0A1M7I431_9BACT|nr:ion transporter [Cyclobacterium lianum]SHM35428.1 voltage-gated potassium channel [Cyclobacterium lianum]